MKTAIVYYSKHHKNTKKLLDVIAQKHDVTLIDVTAAPTADVSAFDRVGVASGIYYSKFHKMLLNFAEQHIKEHQSTFFIYTYGVEKKGYTAAISAAVKKHNAKILGEFGCLGFNTFGPFKWIGGIAKGHPDEKDFSDVLSFYENL